MKECFYRSSSNDYYATAGNDASMFHESSGDCIIEGIAKEEIFHSSSNCSDSSVEFSNVSCKSHCSKGYFTPTSIEDIISRFISNTRISHNKNIDAAKSSGFYNSVKARNMTFSLRDELSKQNAALFGNSFLLSIGIKSASKYTKGLMRRSKKFMLQIYQESERKNIEDIKLRLLLGAFRLRKDLKVRVML